MDEQIARPLARFSDATGRPDAAAGGPPVPEVAGPAHGILAWPPGRDSGTGRQVRPASSRPALPPWR
jgi:hypothetical protein